MIALFSVLGIVIMATRETRIMMQVITVLGMCIGFEVFAQDRHAQQFVRGTQPLEENWPPLILTSSDSAYSLAPTWNSMMKGHQGRADDAHILFTNNSVPSNNQSPNQSASHDPSARSGKTGTGMDSLPSFRGIKGIKNLPGGVGTLLMANPQAGMTWYPEQNTDQTGTTLSMERTDIQGAVPVYSSGGNTFVLTGDFESAFVKTNAILPTTNQKFPSQLFNIALGVNYFHQHENGNVSGVVLDVGTATDKPFQSANNMLASGTAFLLMPRDEDGSWFVGVNASTNSQVLAGLPVPGGGYFYHPSEDFQAIMGFPFSVVSWKPAREWQLQYVWAFLTTMHARVSYLPVQDWQLYAGFEWTNENWRLAERVNEENHFFYYEKKLATGFVWWFRPHVGLDVSTGWAFDRYFTETHGFELVGENTVRIGSGPFVAARFDLRF